MLSPVILIQIFFYMIIDLIHFDIIIVLFLIHFLLKKFQHLVNCVLKVNHVKKDGILKFVQISVLKVPYLHISYLNASNTNNMLN